MHFCFLSHFSFVCSCGILGVWRAISNCVCTHLKAREISGTSKEQPAADRYMRTYIFVNVSVAIECTHARTCCDKCKCLWLSVFVDCNWLTAVIFAVRRSYHIHIHLCTYIIYLLSYIFYIRTYICTTTVMSQIIWKCLWRKEWQRTKAGLQQWRNLRLAMPVYMAL